MTKSIKKIFAALLVVATLALMIPFSASASRTASGKVTFELQDSTVVNKFMFDIYRLATIDLSTGTVTKVSGLPSSVATEVEKEGKTENTENLIKECKKNIASLTKVETWDATTAKSEEYNLGAGIYYIHPIAKGTATLANDSIVVLPKYDNTSKSWVDAGTINLATKVSTKTIKLGKEITNSDIPADKGGKEYATKTYGDIVKFKLTANVPGSDKAKLMKYAILDKMDPGLTFLNNEENKVVVYYTATPDDLKEEDIVPASSYKIEKNFEAKGKTYTFAVNFIPGEGGYIQNIYDANKQMVVTFNAQVNENATVGNKTNDNTVSLNYKNDDTEEVEPGPTVQVFTFKLKVSKVDNTTKAGLAGAEFELRKENDTQVLATAVSDDEGNVVFKNAKGTEYQLAAGKYVVTETKAPEGYVLPTENETTIEIKPTIEKANGKYTVTGLLKDDEDTVVDKDLAFVTRTITNVKITVPQTGGMGTTIFTICGASLIVLAGVMFVVLKRKKTSK